jgi:hypothetical protein
MVVVNSDGSIVVVSVVGSTGPVVGSRVVVSVSIVVVVVAVDSDGSVVVVSVVGSGGSVIGSSVVVAVVPGVGDTIVPLVIQPPQSSSV